jgi:hypothetical protein
MDRRRLLPRGFIEPCIPTLAPKPPAGADWVHEVKHDGYRLIEAVRLFTRRGYDWRSLSGHRQRRCRQASREVIHPGRGGGGRDERKAAYSPSTLPVDRLIRWARVQARHVTVS